MKVAIEKGDGCRRIVSIDVPAEDVKSDYESLLAVYTQQVRLPGFRQGKAPSALVEKRFASQLVEDAKQRLVPRFYQEAAAQEQLKPVTVLDVTDVVFAKAGGLQFKVTVDVAPDFKLPKYEKLTIRGSEPVTTDEDVEKAIDDLRGRFASYEDVEGRAVQAEDLVQVDYSGACDGASLSELASDCQDLGKGEDFWVPVSEPEFLPGFNAGLVGTEMGSEATIDVVFPEDYHVAAVAGKKALYTVKVKAIRARQLPELDEEFLKRVGMETEEALRKMVRENLEEGSKNAEEASRRDAVAEQLLAKSNFDIPESLLEQERNAILRDMISEAARGGVAREAMEAQREGMVQVADERAAKRVRLTYILDAIADKEEVTVNDEDVDARLEEMASRYYMPVDRLRGEMEKHDAGLANLRGEVRAGKVMELILERAKLKIS
jgi:trigger factor